jgi:multidrug efflux pump subunit AcrA (membrane-fusion protein)
MTMKKRNKKWIWAIAGSVVVLVAVLGLVVGPQLRDRAEAETAVGEQDGKIVSVISGDLSASVSGSGQVQAEREARLALGTAGVVDDVYARVGDSVKAGQALVRLESDSLERALASAEQAVAIQVANLATLLAPPTDAAITSAEAAVNSAQVQLDELLAGPPAEDIAASEANLRAVQANVWAASEQLALAQSGAEGASPKWR